MNYAGVFFLLGRLQLALAITLLVPAAVSWYLDDDATAAFLISAGIAAVAGTLSEALFRQPSNFRFGRREAFLLVTLAWTTASVVGAVPYVLIKGAGFFVDALFESASGFTTTGATILTDVEAEPPGLLLWRSMTQWLGGMGIIVLGIAILPKLAIGGMQLLGAEAPGPLTEKLTPRIAQTAKALWAIYALLTVADAVSLILLGMGPLDAVCHAMTTTATAGFSTRADSIGAFGPAIQCVTILFMVISGINFGLHFKLLRGKPLAMLRDAEFRVYAFLLLAAGLLLAGDLLRTGHESDLLEALRAGAFQAAAIITTTGYSTADFDAWPSFSRALLFSLMFLGGCAGSTAGSVKVVRVLIVVKKLAVDLKRLVQPNAVLPVRVGRRAIPDDVVTSVTTFLILFIALFALGGLVLAMSGLDLVSAFSASAACLGNIGPAFGLVGPTQTYAVLPAFSKLFLVALMLVGRLELYTVLVILYASRRVF